MKTIEQLRIVFFGTPDFAVASLNALVHAGANIVAIVTAPDKPAGRGMQLQASAVKQYAESKGLPLLQPEKLKESSFLEALKGLSADLQVVVAFRMMPEVVWNMPPMGTINVHASLLPQYRGAAPINWAIINGETETGVTTFKLKHEIDTGDILLQQKVPILQKDNAGTLHDKLMHAGAELLVKTVKGIAAGILNEVPQDISPGKEIKKAPIRGMSPYPTAFTVLGGKQVKIYRAHYQPEHHSLQPGTYDTDHDTYLRFVTNDGWVYIDELQQEGKKKLDIKSFLKGFRG